MTQIGRDNVVSRACSLRSMPHVLMLMHMLLSVIAASAALETKALGRKLMLIGANVTTNSSGSDSSSSSLIRHNHDTLNRSSGYQTVAAQSSAAAITNDAGMRYRWRDFFTQDEDVAKLIIIFRHHKHLNNFRQICSTTRPKWRQQRTQQLRSKVVSQHIAYRSGDNSSDNEHSLAARFTDPACSALKGTCKHLFSSAIAGVSGTFNKQQFSVIQRCVGSDAIDYIEQDGQVAKAEKGGYGNWWQHKPPQGTTLQQLLALQRRQQQQKKLNSSISEGSSAVSGTTGLPQVQASDGPDNSDAGQATVQDGNSLVLGNASLSKMPPTEQLWQWLLAEVGLSAQQQLTSSSPSVTVLATHGPDSSSSRHSSLQQQPSLLEGPPVITAAEGEGGGAATLVQLHDSDGVDSSSTGGDGVIGQQVTKDQDPGLPVDAAAIANPEIIQLSGHSNNSQSRTAAADQQPLPQQQVNSANEQPGVKAQKLVTALWNLDRIDQRDLPLDKTFEYGTQAHPGTGKGVTIYIVDSGIRTTHQEFQPWGGGNSRAQVGPDFVDDDESADDCDGHGTHVSSTAAGRSVGVAKDAAVVGVRVLDCDGAGSISNVVAALDWVAENAKKPAVASLSLGVPSGMWSRSLETAVANLVATGVSVVVAAGNSAKDSCQVAPARVPEAVTVAASNLPTKFQETSSGDTESLYRWSNTGACIDLYAPGVDIYGACGGPSRCESVTDDAYTWASGTSMAAPHVTGAIAVYLEAHPEATPAQVQEALIAASTDGTVKSDLVLPDTPNRLLYSRGLVDQQVQVMATDGDMQGSA